MWSSPPANKSTRTSAAASSSSSSPHVATGPSATPAVLEGLLASVEEGSASLSEINASAFSAAHMARLQRATSQLFQIQRDYKQRLKQLAARVVEEQVLPMDVLTCVLMHASAKGLAAAAQTCRHWRLAVCREVRDRVERLGLQLWPDELKKLDIETLSRIEREVARAPAIAKQLGSAGPDAPTLDDANELALEELARFHRAVIRAYGHALVPRLAALDKVLAASAAASADSATSPHNEFATDFALAEVSSIVHVLQSGHFARSWLASHAPVCFRLLRHNSVVIFLISEMPPDAVVPHVDALLPLLKLADTSFSVVLSCAMRILERLPTHSITPPMRSAIASLATEDARSRADPEVGKIARKLRYSLGSS